MEKFWVKQIVATNIYRKHSSVPCQRKNSSENSKGNNTLTKRAIKYWAKNMSQIIIIIVTTVKSEHPRFPWRKNHITKRTIKYWAQTIRIVNTLISDHHSFTRRKNHATKRTTRNRTQTVCIVNTPLSDHPSFPRRKNHATKRTIKYWAQTICMVKTLVSQIINRSPDERITPLREQSNTKLKQYAW